MTSTLDSTTAEGIPSTQLLKTDARGRVRVPRERQDALLDEFERSGLSGAKFAALCGVKYPSFAGWVQRRKRQQASASPSAPGIPGGTGGAVRWLESVVGSGPPATALTLHLPGGAHLEISHPSQVPLAAELLRRLPLAPLAASSLEARLC